MIWKERFTKTSMQCIQYVLQAFKIQKHQWKYKNCVIYRHQMHCCWHLHFPNKIWVDKGNFYLKLGSTLYPKQTKQFLLVGFWGLERWFSVAGGEIKVYRVSLFFPFFSCLRANETFYGGDILAVYYSRDFPGCLFFVCFLIGLGLTSDSATGYLGQIN